MVAIIDALRAASTNPTLDSIAGAGGEERLYELTDDISNSDVLDVAATILTSAWERVDKARAGQLILSGLRATNDPIAFIGTVEAVFESPEILQALSGELNDAFLTRASTRTDPRQAHIAVDALDCAIRLFLSGAARPFRLLDLISSVSLDEQSTFAIALTRRLGIIYLYMREDSARSAVRQTLQILADHQDARGDALYQLGATWLVDALEAHTAEEVEGTLRLARRTFTAATEADSERIDAELYAAAIDGVLALVDQLPSTTLRAAVEQVENLALVRSAWKTPGRINRWLGDTESAEQEWWMVTAALARAQAEFDQPYWIDASRSLTAIARAFRAANVARISPYPSPGLKAVVEPRFSAAFVSSHYRMGLLREWTDQIKADPELSQDAARLMEVVEDPKGSQANAISKLRSLISDQDSLDAMIAELSVREQAVLNRRLETLDGEDSVLLNPAARRLSQDLRVALEDSSDYRGSTRILFNRIIDVTIRYTTSRLNVEPGFAKGRFRFLADPDALERDLQLDYWDYLTSCSIGDVVDIEPSHVGGGRADIRFTFGGIRIVAELKRDVNPERFGQLDPYLNQAGMYQSSNVTLGLLMVLDLSPKKHGQIRSVGNSIWIANKPALTDGDIARSIMTVLIAGNRPSPYNVA